MPGCTAHLPEERRLLVAGDAGDRESADAQRARDASRTPRSMPAPPAAGSAGTSKQRQQFVVPRQRLDVEEHRARRVADVGDVPLSAGQLPDEPGVDRAERQLARRGAGAGAGHVVENPADLAAREVGVDEQPGLLLDQRPGAVRLQPLAEVRGPPILPDDGVVDRLAGLAIPDDGRLALVGDADGGDVLGRQTRAPERLDGDADLRSPRSPAGRARPSPASGRSAGTPSAPRRGCRPSRRRRWRGNSSCPDRAKGCKAYARQSLQ